MYFCSSSSHPVGASQMWTYGERDSIGNGLHSLAPNLWIQMTILCFRMCGFLKKSKILILEGLNPCGSPLYGSVCTRCTHRGWTRKNTMTLWCRRCMELHLISIIYNIYIYICIRHTHTHTHSPTFIYVLRRCITLESYIIYSIAHRHT